MEIVVTPSHEASDIVKRNPVKLYTHFSNGAFLCKYELFSFDFQVVL